MSACFTAQDRQWLQRAIDLATANVSEGQRPYGAVVVRGGEVLAQAVNVALRDNDPTAHAELLAIRQACAEAGSLSLTGAVVYASGQPCPMCQSAALFARVARMVYAAPASEAGRAGLTVVDVGAELGRPLNAREAMPMEHLDLAGAAAPFDAWIDRTQNR